MTKLWLRDRGDPFSARNTSPSESSHAQLLNGDHFPELVAENGEFQHTVSKLLPDSSYHKAFNHPG